MGISTKLISAIDSIIYAFKAGTKTSLKDYSDLETILNPTTIVAKDGSMATIYEIYGAKKYVGDEEIIELEERLYSTLKSSLQKEGHQIQFVFSKDKDRIKEHISETLEPYKRAAKTMQLDLDDYFDSKAEHLSKYCAYESCYMVVWSKPELIKETLKEQQQENADRAAKAPLFIDAQNIVMEYERLETAHISMCDTIEKSFDEAEINIEALHVRKAIKDIRTSIDYHNTDKNWEASLPIPIDEDHESPLVTLPMNEKRRYRQSETDASSLFWPSISEQVFPQSIEVIDSNILKMGSRYISPMHIEIPPQNVMPFRNLLDSLDQDIPVQLSFTLESGGLNKARVKAMAASILAVTNAGNKMVRDSIKHLRDLELEGDAIVKFSINAITWSEDLKELNVRKQSLSKKLQSWGNAQTAFNNIDPIEGMVLSQPGVTKKTSSSSALAPLIDIIKMLPLSRQSHVWEDGSMLFRTDDGKLFPFQPGSSLQNTWNDLIFATPGSGKSVLMNAMNLSSIIQPGASELPYIGILDIGPSSAGLINLIKEALPEKLKHLVVYERIQNTKEYAINIFDTMLGSRYPTPSELTFLKNLMTLIMTPVGAKSAYESTDALVLKVIKKAYEVFSDAGDANPKMYHEGFDLAVDEKLKSFGIDAEEDGMCWWEVVDYLYDRKERHLAAIAQRNAVPIMEDLIDIAMSTPAIETQYSKATAATGETMIDLFSRSINEAIDQYPMLSQPTVFDLSEARIISLDLDEVAKGDDDASIKQNAIMFMLGRYVVGKNFKISIKEVKASAHEKYLSHHLKIAKKNRETKKRLCIDEFHRTEGVRAIRSQVKTDQREGRKWNLQVALSSQLIEDFSPDMRKLSTGTFILSGGPDECEDLAKMFALNDSTKRIVKNKLNGPTPSGSPFIFNCKTKEGSYSQFLYSTLSPVEIWNLTTTAEDSTLRDRLAEDLGSSREAIRILSKAFPGGSAKKRIEKIAVSATSESVLKDPYAYLIKKLKDKYDVF